MVYQVYKIHLINGYVIEVAEEFDLPIEDGLITKMEKAGDDELFTIGDKFSGFVYIPKKSILYISTGGVRRVDD